MALEEEEVARLEATVTTGLESVAAAECLEKFPSVGDGVDTSRGRIYFPLPLSQVDQALKLKCIENLYVVLTEIEDFDFPSKLSELEKSMMDLANQVDWKHGLRVWKQCYPEKNLDISEATKELLQTDAAKTKTLEEAEAINPKLQESEATTRTLQEVEATKNLQHTISKKVSHLSISDSAEDKISTPETASGVHGKELSFRVTCSRSGAQHNFTSVDAAKEFGGCINDKFGWRASMKQFDVEVVLRIDGAKVLVCIGLTRDSLFNRNLTHFGPTSLKATIAHGLLRLAEIRTGDVVCDAMCGGASIPLEAACNWPQSHHICGDFHELAVPRAANNLRDLNNQRKLSKMPEIRVDIFKWDVCHLPFRDSTVDAFVVDLPFGRKSGSRTDNRVLYHEALLEMARASRRGSGRVVLLTHHNNRLYSILRLRKVGILWRTRQMRHVNIGGLSAVIFVLHRSRVKFSVFREYASMPE